VALTSNGKTYYRPWRGSQQGTWGPGAWLLGCGRRGSRSGGTGGSIKGQVSEGKVACSEVYSAAFSGPRFPMVHLYLDRLFIVSCPPADEGRDYAGRSPFHSLLHHLGDQRWRAYLYRASVFGPHKNTMITATIAVIAPATAGSQ
jgi:hypothetical protein